MFKNRIHMAVTATSTPEMYSCDKVPSKPTEYKNICIIKHMDSRKNRSVFSIKNMNTHCTLTFYNFLYMWIQVDGKW
jgi:hypothetical protein